MIEIIFQYISAGCLGDSIEGFERVLSIEIIFQFITTVSLGGACTVKLTN